MIQAITSISAELRLSISREFHVRQASLSNGESLYTLNVELLTTLKPDVILTQDICSVCAIDLQTVERVAAKIDPMPSVLSAGRFELYNEAIS